MSTSSCIDLRQTSAAIEWQQDDTTHSLITPDPSNTSIQLSIRLDSREHTLFEVLVPIKLKDIPGSSAIYLRICPSSITSLEFSSSTPTSEDIKQKFGSATRLDLQLNKSPAVLVSTAVGERVIAARPRSGRVLDALYQLSRASAVSIYIENAKLSNDQLRYLSDGVKQGLLQPFPSSDQDISRLFGGKGAKVIELPDPSPPSYTEAPSLPPPPPTDVPAPTRKRARPNSQEPSDDISKVWTELQMINKRNTLWTTAFEALKRENQELKDDNAKLRTELATVKRSQQDLEEEVAELKQKLGDIEDTKDVEKIEIQDDIIALTNRVDYLDRGKDDAAFLAKVTKEVLHQISTRLSGD